ncbi:uncharacterized protein LOC144745214 [Ciona intestinalis]
MDEDDGFSYRTENFQGAFGVNIADFGYSERIAFINDLLLGKIDKSHLINCLQHCTSDNMRNASLNIRHFEARTGNSDCSSISLHGVFVGIQQNEDILKEESNVYIIPFLTPENKHKVNNSSGANDVVNTLLNSAMYTKNEAVVKYRKSESILSMTKLPKKGKPCGNKIKDEKEYGNIEPGYVQRMRKKFSSSDLPKPELYHRDDNFTQQQSRTLGMETSEFTKTASSNSSAATIKTVGNNSSDLSVIVNKSNLKSKVPIVNMNHDSLPPSAGWPDSRYHGSSDDSSEEGPFFNQLGSTNMHGNFQMPSTTHYAHKHNIQDAMQKPIPMPRQKLVKLNSRPKNDLGIINSRNSWNNFESMNIVSRQKQNNPSQPQQVLIGMRPRLTHASGPPQDMGHIHSTNRNNMNKSALLLLLLIGLLVLTETTTAWWGRRRRLAKSYNQVEMPQMNESKFTDTKPTNVLWFCVNYNSFLMSVKVNSIIKFTISLTTDAVAQ